MKYLKKYESLDSSKRERNLRFLGDMSFELGDDGFNVLVRDLLISGCIKVYIQRKGIQIDQVNNRYSPVRFNYNDIKETLLSMISYMESESYSIGSIEVSDMYVHNLIPVKLKGEELYLEYRPEQKVDYSIGQLVIKFR